MKVHIWREGFLTLCGRRVRKGYLTQTTGEATCLTRKKIRNG